MVDIAREPSVSLITDHADTNGAQKGGGGEGGRIQDFVLGGALFFMY